ncbi:MAG TPA: enoyl-CoA hydratase-related protein [Candidatus Margulisiibacteriota bacterium]|nr:enoyl-CoA hydratase-related protein [Candidatus Margulisiibacteriota bacterium]
MAYETIVLEKRDGMGIITLNRPQRLNAWTPVMGAEMADAFRNVDRDPSVRVAVLTGAGRAFCAGADMEFFAGQIAAGGGTKSESDTQAPGPSRVEEFPMLMRRLSKPSIAAINGYALGVGCTMTLLCDMRIAAEEAKLGFLFPRLGVMAELGSTFLLPRLVGLGRACEFMFTGKQFTAAECERAGLVNHVVPVARLMDTVAELAGAMTQCAPLSLLLTRQALYQGLHETFEAQVRYEGFTLDYLYRTRDHAEAVRAFKEKRPPQFEGK